MNKLLLIICLFLSIPLQLFANTFIKGRILNAEAHQIAYSYEIHSIDQLIHEKNYSLHNDSLDLQIDLLDPIEFTIIVNHHRVIFFVMPNDTFIFSFDANDIQNTLKYKCKNPFDQLYTSGIAAIESEKYIALKPYFIEGTGWNTPEGFMSQIEASRTLKLQQFKKNYTQDNRYSSELIKNVIDTTFTSANEGIKRLLINTMVNPSNQQRNDSIIEQVILMAKHYERPDLINNRSYLEFMNHLDRYYYKKWLIKNKIKAENNEWSFKRIAFQNSFYKNDSVKLAMMNFTNGNSNGGDVQNYGRVESEILKYFPNNPYHTIVQKRIHQHGYLVNGLEAPNFTLKDSLGNMVSLSDFKGKWVYLDFWASWCVPCVKENAILNNLKKEYHDKDIVFLYVSRDTNEKVWKNAINDQKIVGTHLIGNQSVFDIYDADAVPKYFLIDTQGKFMDVNPPRPSQENQLRQLFNRILTNP